MRIVLAICGFCVALNVSAQVPSTDIFLTEVKKKEGKLTFSTPRNITHRDGYDNQPWFSRDNKSILYVSMPDSTQTDIYQYNIADSSVKRITETNLSEYSPQYMKGDKTISVVRVDNDKGQRIYELADEDNEPIQLAPGLDSVGYYCWLNDSIIAMVSLNHGLDLLIYEKNNEQFVTAEKGIGRCLLKIPGGDDLLFVKKGEPENSLMIYSTSRGETGILFKGLSEVEDYSFLPDGTLLGGKDGKLYSLDIYGDGKWIEIADFSKSVGNFYRIQVSSDGRYLALVSYLGKKP